MYLHKQRRSLENAENSVNQNVGVSKKARKDGRRVTMLEPELMCLAENLAETHKLLRVSSKESHA